ncbi:hypothetical protein TCAL_11362 [Tigriopus californicus]|uniref:Uncharacterized protein n=1 Tax=Tigriopus californicus TaxID=6832 RepID=A0A553PQM8_TIGCA|nr:hypothetical protein TCAL_11362 [Tigriopus californicus]
MRENACIFKKNSFNFETNRLASARLLVFESNPMIMEKEPLPRFDLSELTFTKVSHRADLL